MGKGAFVTVGTTEFDALIKVVGSVDFVQFLKQHGYDQLRIQYGRGTARPTKEAIDSPDFKIDAFDYKPSITPDMDWADLIISHAGAGSCMEALEAGKKLVVVINDVLADNHQAELAQQLQVEQYLVYSTCRTITEAVDKALTTKFIQPYKRGTPDLFASWLDASMGL
eukprot:m.177698 g.177698  ORF g.177698 m.177698 type:complete len:168 (+) comp18377_c1_seq1:276-779(+)